MSNADAPTVVTTPVTGGLPTQQPPAQQSGPHQVNPAQSGQHPVTGGFPAQSPTQSGSYQVNPTMSGPYQVNPASSGSYPVTAPYQVNPGTSGPYQVNPGVSGPYQVNQQFNFPSTTPAPNRKSNRTALIAVGAAVVVVLAVVGGIFAFSGPKVPNAQQCKADTATDDKGFTKCLRQLAGVVPDGATCKTGGAAGVSGVNAIKGTVVSCTLRDDYEVQYVLTDTVTGAQQGADAVVRSLKADIVEAQWAGNGLEGKYRSSADGGVGLLAFTATDRPLLGIVTKSGGSELTADAIATYFEKNIQPGA
jgi:molecular chaperone DnaK